MGIAFNLNKLSNEIETNELVKEVNFDIICQDSDYLVLACALNKDNRHMINDTVFNKMKSSAYLINVSRFEFDHIKLLISKN